MSLLSLVRCERHVEFVSRAFVRWTAILDISERRKRSLDSFARLKSRATTSMRSTRPPSTQGCARVILAAIEEHGEDAWPVRLRAELLLLEWEFRQWISRFMERALFSR